MRTETSGPAGSGENDDRGLIARAVATRMCVAMSIGTFHFQSRYYAVNFVEADDRIAKLSRIDGPEPSIENNEVALSEVGTDTRRTSASIPITQVFEIRIKVAPTR